MRQLSFQVISDKKRKDGSNVENILEIRYDLPCEKIHAQDAPFVRTARIKGEQLETYLDAQGRGDVR